ncbi:hypothetical protein HYFRA_00013150 [Hymenoscyphus fraxineus]|uniref:Uncharacterized protein n=1 Tax=Hymenoscyphus fraxineus TaxID=746836 RepID=A0A9N9L8D0_9HELO|nr:hypothetical protein HYFRA_00013150 [Hymenoscyphus fraxineus]
MYPLKRYGDMYNVSIEVRDPHLFRVLRGENAVDWPMKRRIQETNHGIHSNPLINDYTSLPGQPLLEQTLGLQNGQHGEYLGQTTEYGTRLINLCPFNGAGEYVSTPGTLRSVSPQTKFIMKMESHTVVDDEITNLDLIHSICTLMVK